MEVVQRRDAATLLLIITAHTAPGSIIHSDTWSAYSRVQNIPSVAAHNMVNHSRNFVGPVSYQCTYSEHPKLLEPGQDQVKKDERLPCSAHQLSYLDEFMWREHNGTTYRDTLTNIKRDITLTQL